MSSRQLLSTVLIAALLIAGFVFGSLARGPHEPSGAASAPQAASGTRSPRPKTHRPTGTLPSTSSSPALPAVALEQLAVQEDDAVQLDVQLDRTAVLRGGDGQLYAELKILAKERAGTTSAPADFVVIVDRSGSMRGEKLAFAKSAAIGLLARVRDDDRLALIAYESDAQVLVPLAKVGAEQRLRFRRAVESMEVLGGTNLSSGLDAALGQLAAEYGQERRRRVLLLSDGLANEGDISRAGLFSRAAAIIQRGAVLTTMGIGDDFDQELMTALAEVGSGNFYYLARLSALPEFFQAELKAASLTVASRLEVEFTGGPEVQLVDASGYTLDRQAGHVRFYPGTLAAGQQRTIWLTLGVPSDRVREIALGSVRVSYEREGTRRSLSRTLSPQVACVASEGEYRARVVRDVWERAVGTEEHGKLKRKLAEAVESGNAEDVERLRGEFRQKHGVLAQQLGSPRVLESVAEVEREASEAKSDQTTAAPERKVRAARRKAGSLFGRQGDKYLSRPEQGLF